MVGEIMDATDDPSGDMPRRANDEGELESYPYLSVPWDQEEDGAAAFDKMPDRFRH